MRTIPSEGLCQLLPIAIAVAVGTVVAEAAHSPAAGSPPAADTLEVGNPLVVDTPGVGN